MEQIYYTTFGQILKANTLFWNRKYNTCASHWTILKLFLFLRKAAMHMAEHQPKKNGLTAFVCCLATTVAADLNRLVKAWWFPMDKLLHFWQWVFLKWHLARYIYQQFHNSSMSDDTLAYNDFTTPKEASGTQLCAVPTVPLSLLKGSQLNSFTGVCNHQLCYNLSWEYFRKIVSWQNTVQA